MRVAVVGAGTLGWTYGVRLAKFGDCDVTWVGKRAEPPRLVRLERVGASDVLEWTAPVRAQIPPVDVIVACVRYENLDAMAERVAEAGAPIVVLTPMMPADFARLSACLGNRVIAAMPSVVAYWRRPEVIRYWIPRAATTLIDAQVPPGVDAELTARLDRAGIAAKREPNVLARNVATTVSFLPLAFGLDIAKGIAPLLRDKALLALVLDGADEGRALAETIGPLAPWASVIARFARPFALKLGIGIVRARAPEVLSYADEHFGRKLHAQNVALAEAMVRLALANAAKGNALQSLLERLRATPLP